MAILVKDGQRKSFSTPEALDAALAEGWQFQGDTVTLQDRQGRPVAVDPEDVRPELEAGAVPESVESLSRRSEEARLEEEFGGTAEAFRAAGEGALGELSLGLYDAIAGDEESRIRRERHPYARLGGEVLGLGVGLGALGTGAIARGVGSTPLGQALRAGEAVAKKTGSRVAGLGVEGSLVGAGTGVTDLKYTDDPLTLETVASTLSTPMIWGAAAGVGGGLLAKAAGKGIGRAKKVIDDVAERAKSGRSATPIADEVAEYAENMNDVFIAADDAGRAAFNKKGAPKTLRESPKLLEANPYRARDALIRQEEALEGMIARRESIAASIARENDEVIEALTRKLDEAKPGKKTIKLSGKEAHRYGEFKGVNLAGKKGVKADVSDVRELLGAMQSGEIQGRRMQALGRLDDILEKNRAAQDAVESGLEARKTARATKEQGRRVLGGLVGATVGGPVGGVMGFAAPWVTDKVSRLVGDRMIRAVTESSTRTAAAIDRLMSTASKGAKVAPMAASKILSSTTLGPAPRASAKYAPAPTKLVTAYREREQELRSQVEPGADGRPRMTPAARKELAKRLAGVKAYSPRLADQIETVVARRIGYLASKLPRRPDGAAMQIGPDRWQPSDFAMRSFARSVRAVEDPTSVEERLADGTVTPEDAEAYRAVYPERYHELKLEIIGRMAELRETLPYKKRLSLSIFFGVPVDPAMDPGVVALLQQSFADEPGTEGGTMAPRANPQFGSIKKSVPEPTPAQERAG